MAAALFAAPAVRSQGSAPPGSAIVALGVPADEKVTNAWYLDLPKEQAVMCRAGVNADKASCLVVKLP